MAMNPKVKNPLILTAVSTFFLIPVLVITHFIFRGTDVNTWIIMLVNVLIYFIVMFLVFLYYANIGKRK